MKFLLTAVNAKYIHSNPAVFSLKGYAMAHMTEAEKENCQIEIVEYTINQQPEQIVAGLFKKQPDVIGFSCYIWNWSMIKSLLPELHKVCPNTKIWLGGPEVSFHGQKILEDFPYLSGIMIGEGEETFLELCRGYGNQLSQEELFQIPGLLTRNGYSAERALTDLNKIPFFYHDLTDFENRIVYYESSRGCPYRCSYCLSSIDKKVRLRQMDLVKQELQFFLDKKVPQVKFIDRTFNCNKEHAMAIWSYLLEHDNGVTNFHFEISADILSQEELDLLGKMRPGLAQLEIGVQSTNPETIQAIARKMDVEKLRKVVEQIRNKENIHVHLDLIVGLPYEDFPTFQNSFNEVYSMYPEQLQLGFLKVLKGSPIEVQAKEYGIAYKSEPNYEVLYTNWISYEEVLRLKAVEEMLETFYNSNQFRHTIGMLEQYFPSPFVLYQSLAEYYEKKGYDLQSPARVKRYEILRDFAVEHAHMEKEMAEELLTYDMYLRENMKTRPEFAKDLTPYKEIIREIYQKEEEARNYLPEYTEYNSKQLAKMTHMEVFRYSVWQLRNCHKLEKEAYVLFEYQARNPLTKDSRVIWIDRME